MWTGGPYLVYLGRGAHPTNSCRTGKARGDIEAGERTKSQRCPKKVGETRGRGVVGCRKRRVPPTCSHNPDGCLTQHLPYALPKATFRSCNIYSPATL